MTSSPVRRAWRAWHDSCTADIPVRTDLSRPMDLAALRRWWPLAAVLGLLFVTSLAATRSAPQLNQLTPDPEPAPTAPPLFPGGADATPAGGTPPAAADAAKGLPDWIGTAALVVLGIAGAVIVALVVWALVRDRMRRHARRTGRHAPVAPAPRTAEDLVAAL